MARIWDIRKKNQTLILNLKEMCPDGKIPPGTLIEGKQGITDRLKQFLMMKSLDSDNEKWHGPRKYTLDTLSKTLDVKSKRNKQKKLMELVGAELLTSLYDSIKVTSNNKDIRRLTLPNKGPNAKKALLSESFPKNSKNPRGLHSSKVNDGPKLAKSKTDKDELGEQQVQDALKKHKESGVLAGDIDDSDSDSDLLDHDSSDDDLQRSDFKINPNEWEFK
mmetsp:Transcript_3389/g.5705  ORF Transcript_3389/g.5705 Transcript_3389/m.5705 type:complete len:220 (+) Transcript_3389:1462-2121(+)